MLSESTLIKTLTLILNLCLKLLPHDYALIKVSIQNLTCILIFFYLKNNDNIVYVSMFKDRITCRFSFKAQTDFS